MRVIITGASGFIGGCLMAAAPPSWKIWGTRLNSHLFRNTPRILRVDLRDAHVFTALINGLKPNLIIHAAAYSRVAYCELYPAEAWRLNAQVTADLAKTCAEHKIRLLFLSSDMVFDGVRGDFCEQDKPNPLNFYGWTKLAAERSVLDLGLLGIVARINLTYGLSRSGGCSFSEEVIHTVRSKTPYRLFTDQIRSYISVSNLVDCLWELAGGDFHGIVHLGGIEAADRYTFALRLADKVGLDKNLLIASSTQEAGREARYPLKNTFDVRLAQSLLKTPLLDLEEGLSREYA
jgi:dTDP-4-dehydrorhamnose reductase